MFLLFCVFLSLGDMGSRLRLRILRGRRAKLIYSQSVPSTALYVLLTPLEVQAPPAVLVQNSCVMWAVTWVGVKPA